MEDTDATVNVSNEGGTAGGAGANSPPAPAPAPSADGGDDNDDDGATGPTTSPLAAESVSFRDGSTSVCGSLLSSSTLSTLLLWAAVASLEEGDNVWSVPPTLPSIWGGRRKGQKECRVAFGEGGRRGHR